jgi:hypothetical protein
VLLFSKKHTDPDANQNPGAGSIDEFADDFGDYGPAMVNYFCSPRNHVGHLTQPS